MYFNRSKKFKNRSPQELKLARRFLKRFAWKLAPKNMEALELEKPSYAKYLKRRAKWSRQLIAYYNEETSN